MTRITNLTDDDTLTNFDIASAAFDDFDTEFNRGEGGYILTHPSNADLTLVFSLERDEEGNVNGWTYSTYEVDADGSDDLISTDGFGLDDGEDLSKLLENISNTLEDWAS